MLGYFAQNKIELHCHLFLTLKKYIEHVNSDIDLNWKLETKSLCEIKLLALIIGLYCFNNTLTITITVYWINFVFA